MKGNAVRLVHFFLLPLIFTLVAASISHFLTAATKFLCCSSNKKVCPLSLAVALCRSFLAELRWPVSYFLFFSVVYFLYIPNLWTWQTISAFRFRFY